MRQDNRKAQHRIRHLVIASHLLCALARHFKRTHQFGVRPEEGAAHRHKDERFDQRIHGFWQIADAVDARTDMREQGVTSHRHAIRIEKSRTNPA